jgi:MOSC domain-containing protein YiiM
MAEIYSLVYKPQDENAPDHYTRIPLESATLVAGHGIQGDLNGKGDPKRGLNVMSFETMAGLGGEGFQAQPGQLGEQIVVRGLDVDALPGGTRLQFGDSAVIEVVKLRTGCDRFEAIQGKSAKDAQGRLGIMARVVTGGTVRVGDPVTAVAELVGK